MSCGRAFIPALVAATLTACGADPGPERAPTDTERDAPQPATAQPPADSILPAPPRATGRAAAVKSYQTRRDAWEVEREGQGTQFSDAERAVIERAKTELAAQMPDPGLDVGDVAPGFSLPNASGKTVTLADHLTQGPVVVVFYRGAWCPFCNLYLRTLADYAPQFEALGARVIAVTPQLPDASAEQVRDEGYPFEIVSDLDASVMKAYRLYFEVDPELEALYRNRGLDLADYNGEGRDVLPAPGTFVIDSDGVVRAAFATTDYKARMEPAEIVATLQQLVAESG